MMKMMLLPSYCERAFTVIRNMYQFEFLQTYSIDNNANIGIRGFTKWKQKFQ